jgi:hypothetical protein
LSALGVGETGTGGSLPDNSGKIYVEPIGSMPLNDILPLQNFSSSDENVFKMSSNLINGTATFTAGNTNGNAVVTAKDKNGNSETYMIEVVEPQKIRMELQQRIITLSDTRLKYKNVYHNKSFFAILCLVTYIEPVEVSFFKISVNEDVAQYNLVGEEINLYRDNGISTNHSAWSAPVSRGNILKGSYVLGPNPANSLPQNPLPFDASGAKRPDTKASGWNTGYGPGKITIILPWKFNVGNITGKNLDSVDAIKNFDGSKATITKQSVTETFNYFPTLSLQ